MYSRYPWEKPAPPHETNGLGTCFHLTGDPDSEPACGLTFDVTIFAWARKEMRIREEGAARLQVSWLKYREMIIRIERVT